MQIGLISDTHDNLPLIHEAVLYFKKARVKHILHAGDIISPFSAKALASFSGEIHAVFGNNDGEREGLSGILKSIQDPPLRLELEKRRILLLHDLDTLGEEDRQWAEVVVFGHTHQPALEAGQPILINPGEGGGWLEGMPTVGLLNLETLHAEIRSIEDGATVMSL